MFADCGQTAEIEDAVFPYFSSQITQVGTILLVNVRESKKSHQERLSYLSVLFVRGRLLRKFHAEIF